MTLAAGIDVGNSTTEIVIADMSVDPPRPVAWDRAPTRGRKGSERSWAGAARLLQRLEARTGLHAEYVVATPQQPVTTSLAQVQHLRRAAGRLAIGARASATPGSPGLAVGVPVDVAQPPSAGDGPAVLSVRREVRWQDVPGLVRAWRAAGRTVVGLLLEDDTGVLVARRLPEPVPVVLDLADVALASAGVLVAVEVADHGRTVRTLADPVALSAALGLDHAERPDAVAVSRRLAGATNGVVVVFAEPVRADPADSGAWVDIGGHRLDFASGVSALRSAPVGATTAYRLPDATPTTCADAWAAELSVLEADLGRAEAAGASFVFAGLADEAADVIAPGDVLAGLLDRDVRVGPGEGAAAWRGAATTPAAVTDVVVDLGGGTIDLVSGAEPGNLSHVVAAGAGDLLTAAVAAVLGIPFGAADWVKRGPASRVEAPQVLLGEDGARRFLDTTAPPDAVGSLVVPGPAGLLPFDRHRSPAEWRLLRRRLKDEVLSANVRRALAGEDTSGADTSGTTGDVMLVGGPAGDDEVVDVVARALPGRSVGRADVAGVLGHRWAVAYGLLLASSTSATFGR